MNKGVGREGWGKCVKISGSLWMLSAFWLMRFPEHHKQDFNKKVAILQHVRIMGTTDADKRFQTTKSWFFLQILLPLCRWKGQLLGLLGLRQVSASIFGIRLRPCHENWNKPTLPCCHGDCVLDQKGVLLVNFKPAGTINTDRYCETLKKLRRAIQNRRIGMLSKATSPQEHTSTHHPSNRHSHAKLWLELHHTLTV